MLSVHITKEEQKSIRRLKSVAKSWPENLSLFSWSGTLVVMTEVQGKFCIVDYITNIPNDGGDPNMGDEVWGDTEVIVEYEI